MCVKLPRSHRATSIEQSTTVNDYLQQPVHQVSPQGPYWRKTRRRWTRMRQSRKTGHYVIVASKFPGVAKAHAGAENFLVPHNSSKGYSLRKNSKAGRSRKQGVAESNVICWAASWTLGSDTPAKSTHDYSSHQAEEMIRQRPDFALTVG